MFDDTQLDHACRHHLGIESASTDRLRSKKQRDFSHIVLDTCCSINVPKVVIVMFLLALRNDGNQLPPNPSMH